MNDQTNPASEAVYESSFDSDHGLATARETLSQFLDAAGVQAVYGEPVQNGDIIVIPSAEVLSVMGFGVGTGRSRGSDENASGGGGGGGGRVLSRPVAAIVISPDDARVEPIVDVTKVALAGLTAAGFMLGMLMRMSRRRAPDLESD